MVGAVQDHFVTPVGQARPTIWNVQNIIRTGRLKPARAERAHPIRMNRPMLSPWSDDHMGTCQRIDAETGFAHYFIRDRQSAHLRAGAAYLSSRKPSSLSACGYIAL